MRRGWVGSGVGQGVPIVIRRRSRPLTYALNFSCWLAGVCTYVPSLVSQSVPWGVKWRGKQASQHTSEQAATFLTAGFSDDERQPLTLFPSAAELGLQ